MSSEVHRNILGFIIQWVKTKQTPVPQKEIVAVMLHEGVKDFTTINALNILKRKGYIRRGMAKSATYILLRTI